ncbi:MAG: glycosyltransferase family 4 protein [Anaerolineales bacterium]|nr:glycosyltransferase family 4 protein [Anaerolineales bacterium]
MIIGIDASRALTEQKTGTEAYAHHLIQHLLPLAASAGHQIRLYFNVADETVAASLQARYPGDHVTIVNVPLRRLWTHVRLGWELRQSPPDLFFTPAHVIPAGYHGPSVATVHDLGYHHFPDAHPPNQLRYLRWSTRHNARVSRLVIVDSEATRQDLQQLYGVPGEKIVVVYPGLTPGLAPVTDQAVLRAVARKYKIRGDYLLFIGTLQPRKNLARLIAAYDRYFESNDGQVHKLVLAGKLGWRSEGIVKALTSLKFPNYTGIITPGFIDEADKSALISGATALLFPSLYEGFGFPALEAQHCGTPVLTANSSSLPEICGPDGALYIDPEDLDAIHAGMLRLMREPELRDRLSASGRENSKRFSWQTAAAQVLELLERASRGEA